MEKLRKILQEMHPEVDFDTCTTLIDDGYFDSLDVVNLIVEISDEFDIEIPPQEVVPANFNSMKTIYEMIKRLE